MRPRLVEQFLLHPMCCSVARLNHFSAFSIYLATTEWQINGRCSTMQQIKEDPWTYRRKVERKYVSDILTYFVWSKGSHIIVRDGQRSFCRMKALTFLEYNEKHCVCIWMVTDFVFTYIPYVVWVIYWKLLSRDSLLGLWVCGMLRWDTK